MAQIEVKYDPTLTQEPIVDIMYSTEEDPDGIVYQVDQTKITGIAAPLIKLNDITINFTQVKSMTLTCKKLVPTLEVTIEDSLGLTKALDHPKTDNILRLQILPPFEDAYKKVDLTFYITHFESNGDNLELTCKYNIKELYKNRLEAFGELSFYGLCDRVAKDCQLGLASNVADTDDPRYMYCSNQSYLDLLKDEIKRSGTQKLIPEVWVDWFNYLNIVDIWERYQSTDPMYQIWSLPSSQIDTSAGKEIEPSQEDAVLTNTPSSMQSQLYVQYYQIVNKSKSNVQEGTDKIVEIYHYDKNESESMLIQDGDVHEDVFVKTIYMGEAFGGSSFQLQNVCRNAAIQKIHNQCILTTLSSPLLGLVRGSKVEFRWFDVNDYVVEAKQENDVNTTSDGEDDVVEKERYALNKQISGQYLILETELRYDGSDASWHYDLLLGRPADQVKTYGEDNNKAEQ